MARHPGRGRPDDFKFNTGPILERGVTAMPPPGAKGMNLAIADVAVLAEIIDDVITLAGARSLASEGKVDRRS